MILPDTPMADNIGPIFCNNLGYATGCGKSFGKPAPAEEAAQKIITSTAQRMYDIWYPDYQHGWWYKLMHHIWPETVENFKNVLPKKM